MVAVLDGVGDDGAEIALGSGRLVGATVGETSVDCTGGNAFWPVHPTRIKQSKTIILFIAFMSQRQEPRNVKNAVAFYKRILQ